MCEIYAINAGRPVRANRRLREFFSDSTLHPHGWGLAWREDGEVRLHKEPTKAVESPCLDCILGKEVRAARLIAHIRTATRGTVSEENCHPFVGRDASGTSWVVAHNGTMLDTDLLKDLGRRPKGTTDSEQVMLFLLDRMDEALAACGRALTADERFEVLAEALAALSLGNKLNLVLGDGELTYVHTNTIQETLWWWQGQAVALVCSRPMGKGWEPVPRCQLMALRDGRAARIAHPHGGLFDDDCYLRLLTEGATPLAL